MHAAKTLLLASFLAACGGAPDGDAVDGGADATSPSAVPLATGVRIRDVALFQTIKLPLVVDGLATTPPVAPLPAHAGALRIYVDAVPVPRAVTAELLIDDQTFSTTGTVSPSSSDDVPGSALTIPLPADALTTGARWSVRLRADDGVAVPVGPASEARFPADGSDADLGVAAPTALHLVLVPLRYDTDGSGRLPDTSPAQLARYADLVRALYPVSELTLDVHAPLPWSGSLTITGNVNFGAVNGALYDLRAADGAAADAHYYGLVAPDVDFDSYCGGSCVTGQSYVVDDPADAAHRVGSGVGWTGEDSAWTLVHEVGHILGRYHAPCGASSADADFPYPGGVVGVWGYDDRDGSFLPPTDADFMGYCPDTWTSDYTYAAIDQRLRDVAALKAHAPRPASRSAVPPIQLESVVAKP